VETLYPRAVHDNMFALPGNLEILRRVETPIFDA
jgi:hypothetical protein